MSDRTGLQIFKIKATGRSSLFSNKMNQLSMLLKITVAVILVLTFFGLGTQNAIFSLNLSDISLYIVILLLSLGLYYLINRMIQQRMEVMENREDQELQIFEYGIRFPPIANPLESSDIDENPFIRFNQMKQINAHTKDFPGFEIVTEDQSYLIDLRDYSGYSPEVDQEDKLRQLSDIMIKIRDNLMRVENRDHPTVIPRSYFRDILTDTGI